MPRSVAMGWAAAADAGVPTAPISAKDVETVNELTSVGNGGLGLISVVTGFQDEAVIVHAAFSIYFPECGKNAEPHALAQQTRRSRQGGGLSEDEPFAGERLRPNVIRCRCGQDRK